MPKEMDKFHFRSNAQEPTQVGNQVLQLQLLQLFIPMLQWLLFTY